MSIVDLAEQLGHAATMTLDTYSHVMRGWQSSGQALSSNHVPGRYGATPAVRRR